ncbi:molybdenum cofactor biosynthesis protein MoaE [Asaia sp. HumB]|nr:MULTISPECIES: molybdenum cofactor biosynthesis protein MoaE [Asaia]ETC97867.1 molybdopterin-converting factor chain 2 [Asaia sp. SF2.1]MDL2170648.1 molybdenum cofactor biosynthesis protein MoaE [Asaia sp. HumB]
MTMFLLTETPIEPDSVARVLRRNEAGGYCSFEGWVRNHSEGQAVLGLDYQAYRPLAEAEAALILQEAESRFDIVAVSAIHRIGSLGLGDMAVWIGVSAAHRDAAFVACRYVIDEIKRRVPIWKRERYADGHSEWIACHDTEPSPEL